MAPLNSSNYKFLMYLQIVLTVIGTIVAAYNFVDTMAGDKTLLSVLFAISYLLSYIALIVYATVMFRRSNDFDLQLVVYAYAAVLGIQILQNGQFMGGLGLSEGLVLFINAANLIAFANTIKFADKLSERKIAIAYLGIAVALKLIAELILIVLFIGQVDLFQVLKSLSVPILGATILFAYSYRLFRSK